MRNPIFIPVEVDAEAAPLSATPLRGDVQISTHPDNSDDVTIAAGSFEADLWPGLTIFLENVDLNAITAAGTEGDSVLVAGNTPA